MITGSSDDDDSYSKESPRIIGNNIDDTENDEILKAIDMHYNEMDQCENTNSLTGGDGYNKDDHNSDDSSYRMTGHVDDDDGDDDDDNLNESSRRGIRFASKQYPLYQSIDPSFIKSTKAKARRRDSHHLKNTGDRQDLCHIMNIFTSLDPSNPSSSLHRSMTASACMKQKLKRSNHPYLSQIIRSPSNINMFSFMEPYNKDLYMMLLTRLNVFSPSINLMNVNYDVTCTDTLRWPCANIVANASYRSEGKLLTSNEYDCSQYRDFDHQVYHHSNDTHTSNNNNRSSSTSSSSSAQSKLKHNKRWRPLDQSIRHQHHTAYTLLSEETRNQLLMNEVKSYRLEVDNTRLAWKDNHVILSNLATATEPFRTVPLALRELIREHLSHVGSSSYSLRPSMGVPPIPSDTKKSTLLESIISKIDISDITATVYGNRPMYFIQKQELKYQALECALARNFEPVIDTTLEMVFSFFDPYLKVLSKEWDEDLNDADDAADDDTAACSDGYGAVNKDDNDDNRSSSRALKRKRASVHANHTHETDSREAYGNYDNGSDSDGSSDDDDDDDDDNNNNNKKSVHHKRKYKNSHQGSSTNNTDSRKERGANEKRRNWKNIKMTGKIQREDDEDSIITWEHVMYAIESNYKEIEKKGMNTKLFVHQDLPELKLTPGVIYRTQQRLLKLYGVI